MLEEGVNRTGATRVRAEADHRRPALGITWCVGLNPDEALGVELNRTLHVHAAKSYSLPTHLVRSALSCAARRSTSDIARHEPEDLMTRLSSRC